jgi:hypothetical protein
VWGACGGLSSTPAQQNTADPAFCCASGTTCTYLDDYYWQCLPPAAGGGGGGSTGDTGGSSGGGGSSTGSGGGGLKIWDQCGGMGGNCNSYGCVDGPYSGASCPAGAVCQRSSSWYYQCLPSTGSQQQGGGQGDAPQPATTGARWQAGLLSERI